MQNTTKNYKLEINKPSREFECKITIGDNIYTNEDLVNLTLEYTQPQEGFSIGNTISQSLDLTLLNRSDIIYSTSQIKVEIGLKVGSKFEYILMGIFNIDDIEKTDYTTKFTAYDNMIKFESVYFSELGNTPTLQQVINELENKTGVKFIGTLPTYTVTKLEGFSCREVLSYVASICGGNAFITREGKFTIKGLCEVEKTIDGNNYFEYKKEEIKYKIGKISCQVDENNILSKGSISTDSMELEFENPWVTENILNDIYTKLKSIEYLGYSIKWQGDISLDPYDIITITDVKNITRRVPIFSQKFNYTGGLTAEIGAKGESKNKNSFSSSGSTSNKVNRVVMEQAVIKEALINKANIRDLEASNAKIENLQVKTASIESTIIGVAYISDLTTINANIQNLIAADAKINTALINKADIMELNAVQGNITSLNSQIANIQTLVNGNLSSENIQSGGITSDKLTIANGFIINAMIDNLDVSKINAGDISTNKFRIVSDNGGIEIVGATQQFKDKNNKVRIQMGQDTKGDFNFILRGEDGATTLIDHNGIKEKAIADDLIKENMVATDAIGEKQINYKSLIIGLNKDSNTNLIKASKVAIDLAGQTLDLAFNSLKNQADNNKNIIENHSTNISAMQGQISTAINNTQIVKDGKTILLKDDYNRTVSKVDSINSTIVTHTTKIDTLTGNITSVDTKVNSVQRDLEGTKSTLSSHTSLIDGLNSKVTSQESSINQLQNQISLKVNSTELTTMKNELTGKIDSIQIGGRNLLLNTSKEFKTVIFQGWDYYFPYISNVKEGDTFSACIYLKPTVHTTKVMIEFRDESGNYSQYISDAAITVGKEGYVSVSATCPKGKTKVRMSIRHLAKQTKDNVVQYKEAKFEKGSKSTDWTPAPEDISDSINTKANLLDVYNKTEVYTKEQTDSAINIAKDQINLGIKNVYETKINVETKVNNAVTNLKVGGDNLLRNGNFSYNMANWSVHDMNSAGSNKSVNISSGGSWIPEGKKVLVIRGTNTINRYGVISSSMKLTPNTKYTISGYCAGHRVGTIQVNVRDIQNSNVNIHTLNIAPVTGGTTLDKWYRFETTFTTTTNTDFALNLYSQNFQDNGYVWFCDVQIQQGTKATAWIPCLEDINTSINSKANSSDVYKKTEVYTKSETTSQINVAQDSITNIVSQSYLSKSDATNTYATKSSLTQTTNNITAKFEGSGGYNLIKNSSGVCKTTAMWSNSAGTTMGVSGHTGIGSSVTQFLYLDNGTNTTEKFAYSSRFKLKPNTKYTFTGYFHNYTKCPSFDVYVLSSTDVDETNMGTGFTHVNHLVQAQSTGATWKKYKITFITPASIKSGIIRIDNNGYNANGSGNNRVHWNALMLVEGELEMPWSPHPDEIYTGSTIIDATGVTINNGALRVKNKSGTIVLEGDSNGNLLLTGTVKSQSGERYVSLDSGGITFNDYHNNEQMLRVAMSYFSANRDINGVTFAMPLYSDFMRFSYMNKTNLTNGWSSSDTQYNFFDLWSVETNLNGSTTKKGMTIYSPLYIKNKATFTNTIELENAGTPHQITLRTSASDGLANAIGIYGNDGVDIGYRSGTSNYSRIRIIESSFTGTSDQIKSWGNWNMCGYTLHNVKLANYSGYSLTANPVTRTSLYTSPLEMDGDKGKYLYTNVQLKNGKAILSIPRSLKGLITGYEISCIVKKGRGDIWIEEELENRFTIMGTEDIKVNIEITYEFDMKLDTFNQSIEAAPIAVLNK